MPRCKRLKGAERPLQNERARAEVLAALEAVDLVVIFDEDTPLRLIEQIKPNVLVKGGDYTREQVVGHEVMERERRRGAAGRDRPGLQHHVAGRSRPPGRAADRQACGFGSAAGGVIVLDHHRLRALAAFSDESSQASPPAAPTMK